MREAFEGDVSYTVAAKRLSERLGDKVSTQRLRAWVDALDPDMLEDRNLAKELARSRNAMAENVRIRADNRALVDALGSKQEFFDSLSDLIDDLNSRPPVPPARFIGGQAGKPMTVELLLSDLQIGKLGPGYSSKVAERRLWAYAQAALFQIEQKRSLGYRIERIILAIIGDIIESDKKHKNSARATDTGTSTQMFDAMKGLFLYVIEPLAKLGIQLDIIGVTGNHDWDDHGINMWKPGKEHLSYPLYKGIELLCDRSGYENITWDIPEGTYTTATIYGQHVLYEHGVGVSVNENAMRAHKTKRSQQEKKFLTYFRMGDKHTVTSFNSGELVVNGAFFGATKGGTEYSGIAGFDSIPAQWMGFHVERDDDRFSLYDTFTIQLGHVND